MNHSINYPYDFPESITPRKKDVITMAENGNWNELSNTIVCQNCHGEVTARFGEQHWDMSPYKAKEKDKGVFDFSEFATSIDLQLEMKLIVYGWLFYQSNKTKQASKLSTLIQRFSALKRSYLWLLSVCESSLHALSNKKKWAAYEDYLIQKNLGKTSLHQTFGSINSALRLQHWLRKDFGFEAIQSKNLAERLSKKQVQQTLVIPESVSDLIYGKAIELVENAYPYRKQIALTESALQANYLAGKQELDIKIKSGVCQWLTDKKGNIINKHEHASEIGKHEPCKKNEIIVKYLAGIDTLAHIKNGRDFNRYFGQLITASYICCGAFSGMRDSELGELTPESYFCERFDNRDYHMLQSRTFKFGNKRETWVSAPISEKAISLTASLTEQWRVTLKSTLKNYHNTLWINRSARSNPPVIINDWNKRLQRFCSHFDIIVSEKNVQECLESNPQSKDKIAQCIKIGQPWHLTPHQFRRTLAFYTIKHRLGTTLSLKQQFKHLYLAMTEWYTNGGKLAGLKSLKLDSQLQQLINDASDENTTNLIFNMVYSDKTLSGSHGKAIVKMRDDIPYIYSSWDVIYAAVKNKTLTLNGTSHSYCNNGYNCDMDGVVNPAFCVDCSSGSSIIDEDNAKWWQKKHSSLISYFATEKDISPSEYSHLITQIRAAEIVMKDFGMSFTQYKHPIEIVEL